MVQLPLKGYDGPTPEWPLSDPSPDEVTRWARLWKHPAAIVWHQQQLEFVVARYVRDCLKVEEPRSSAVLKAEVRQQEDRLGLNPTAMMRLRWEVVQDELAAKRNDEPRTPAVRRLRVADTEIAA
jgi:hypothetical protein